MKTVRISQLICHLVTSSRLSGQRDKKPDSRMCYVKLFQISIGKSPSKFY